MTTDFLTLTSYFGERQRVSGALFADAQMDRFAHHKIGTSVLLRGISGFGLKHHYRSDRPLTLSEDLPLVSVAIDTRREIERLIDDLSALGHRGLVTVERTCLLRGVRVPELPDAVKLSIHLGRGEQTYRVPAYAAVCELLQRRGIDAAIAFLGVDGTRAGRRARAHLVGRNADVPVMITAVGPRERVERVLPELGALLREPTILIERAQICKRAGRLLEYPRVSTVIDRSVPAWQKLTVYTSAVAMYEGEPIHRALVRRLRAGDARGVTVLSGFWGFQDRRPPRGDQLWRLGRDVPICTVLLDTPQRLVRSFDVVDELTAEHGLVTCETVPALVASSGGPVRPPTLNPRPFPTKRAPARSRSIARWT